MSDIIVVQYKQAGQSINTIAFGMGEKLQYINEYKETIIFGLC
ncbi:hypothetical protein MNBD_BACTEROID07-638 [hydrothermal vent metagenome]|uniref:Uncharacterized protein n=1 Tax=hydrothermal vent metagenome TaxID=652676 RepID=A0A3B0UBV5_9ZZZZ